MLVATLRSPMPLTFQVGGRPYKVWTVTVLWLSNCFIAKIPELIIFFQNGSLFAANGRSRIVSGAPSISDKVYLPPTPEYLLYLTSIKFSLAADPAGWGTILTSGQPEPDDAIHNPDRRDNINSRGAIFTLRGLTNLGCIILLFIVLVGLL